MVRSVTRQSASELTRKVQGHCRLFASKCATIPYGKSGAIDKDFCVRNSAYHRPGETDSRRETETHHRTKPLLWHLTDERGRLSTSRALSHVALPSLKANKYTSPHGKAHDYRQEECHLLSRGARVFSSRGGPRRNDCKCCPHRRSRVDKGIERLWVHRRLRGGRGRQIERSMTQSEWLSKRANNQLRNGQGAKLKKACQVYTLNSATMRLPLKR
jgi:hypothetical protein